MKTIFAEVLTPVLAVCAKIPCVESLLLFPRRDGKALGLAEQGNCVLMAPCKEVYMDILKT
jgi:N-acetyl-beta-hexosaminidase